ncbi:MAG: hypothetical protein WDM71_00190 [Ferruginibacter sp.]
MFPKINLTSTAAWKELTDHYEEIKSVQMKDLFKADPERFAKYSLTKEDILFDFSKNIITEKTFQLLQKLANECKLKDAINAMFDGEKINQTENRSVLHTALRNFSGKPVLVDGKDVIPM